ncbi:MAG: serine hydrolase [Acidobacteriia bacterium]|nr:serine hydrolase [Terriglobia bacterium]
MPAASMRVRAFGVVLFMLLLETKTAAPPIYPIVSLRLLPPVLLKDEKGWSLEERMKHYKVEAVSVAVISNFQVLWRAAYGFADREEHKTATTETLFQAGSISKSLAAAGILRKAQDGAWFIDRDVNQYLKSWKVPENGLTAKQKVTLERILSHSAGLTVHGFPGYEIGLPVPTIPQVLDGSPPANTAPVRVDIEPGTKWRYSGGGYTVAQLAMIDTFGRPFPSLMAELVLKPAGMMASTYQQPLPPEKLALAAAGYRQDGTAVPGKRHTYPEMAAAGLWTTAGDLARFAIAIQKSLRADKASLLSKETAQRMVTPFIENDGLGFFIEKHGDKSYFGHGGADEGFQALLLASLDGSYGAAIMVNSDNGIALANEIMRGIARQYGWQGYLPEPLEAVKLPTEALAGFAGRYQLNGDEAFTIEAQGDRLHGKPPVGDAYELFPISSNVLIRKDRDTRYQIERSEGKVTGVLLIAGEERVTAKRMAPGIKLPSDDLLAGHLEEALHAYRELRRSKPNDPGVSEARLNRLGYNFLARKEYVNAIAVLKLNAEFYPTSSNTYDSLAEAYLASGDRTRSLETYRKVLEVLPTDSKTSAESKDQLRHNAEAKIRELSK